MLSEEEEEDKKEGRFLERKVRAAEWSGKNVIRICTILSLALGTFAYNPFEDMYPH